MNIIRSFFDIANSRAILSFKRAVAMASNNAQEFLLPENWLLALLADNVVNYAITMAGADTSEMYSRLVNYIARSGICASDGKFGDDYFDDASGLTLEEIEQLLGQEEDGYDIDHLADLDTLCMSAQLEKLLGLILEQADSAEAREVGVPHLIQGMLGLEDSYCAAELTAVSEEGTGQLMAELISVFGNDDFEKRYGRDGNLPSGMPDPGSDLFERPDDPAAQILTCINDHIADHNPLIGREEELDRTIRVLCRKDKNNPLHVGEPGVGKTALIYGLAAMIERGDVPEPLKGSRIYSLDLGAMVAGTQFRGDFEKRIKDMLRSVESRPGSIIYIDEIHNLVGAGAVNGNSLDASNILKPYLESGSIRFIGATTYDEFKRYFARSKSLLRRFRQIDIAEPSIGETVTILRQLRPVYEAHHDVSFTDEALTFAAEASARYITDRYLPDKAIDLIDEAGAYRRIHPREGEDAKVVDRDLVASILARICHTEAIALKEDSSLATLRERIGARVFGQDAAVDKVTEAVQMARAGLIEEGKPLASFLFVGPTGVGKTEVARVLADEMGMELVRFDMSEYAEKHTVAKLIGSPAGYTGYEDGGLLTDAIRRSPNCVLLLDEIEKAHSDIYNILLQVMDYARLTDNRGQHADFSNVVVIMTSNAGAQHASQASVGFASRVTAGDAMLSQVKKIFKPEFINRLSATVVFRSMDRPMASMILDKKLRALSRLLAAKNVTMELSDDARNAILDQGFSAEYGARELDRVISSRLKPMLMRAILFGPLKQGGAAVVSLSADGEFCFASDDSSTSNL